jgi:hypothetical protein
VSVGSGSWDLLRFVYTRVLRPPYGIRSNGTVQEIDMLQRAGNTTVASLRAHTPKQGGKRETCLTLQGNKSYVKSNTALVH